jgi:hypothetical protein
MSEREKKTRQNRHRASEHSRLVTLQQASEEYGPPYTSLRDLVIRGALPGVRFGDGDKSRIWVRRTDLERLIETRTER